MRSVRPGVNAGRLRRRRGEPLPNSAARNAKKQTLSKLKMTNARKPLLRMSLEMNKMPMKVKLLVTINNKKRPKMLLMSNKLLKKLLSRQLKRLLFRLKFPLPNSRARTTRRAARIKTKRIANPKRKTLLWFTEKKVSKRLNLLRPNLKLFTKK